MGFEIINGVGAKIPARVDNNNRLHTQTIQEPESLHAAEIGDAYNLNTGLISFSGDGTLAYLHNDEAQAIVVESIAVGTFSGITYTDFPYLTLVRNPTGGNLITDATTTGVIKQNRNAGSNNVLGTGTLFYKGKSSGTLTGGADWGILQSTQGGRSFYTINFLLERGSSIGFKINNFVSTGSANIYIAIICYIKDPESKS